MHRPPDLTTVVRPSQAPLALQRQHQLQQIQLLSSQHPDSVNLHFLLADRYMDLRMAGPAKDEFTQVLNLDPNNGRAKKGLAKLEGLKGGPDKTQAQKIDPSDGTRKQ